MKAAIYARVSTEEQKKHGVSLDAQVARCLLYAQTIGITVIHSGVEGESAKDTDRPELQVILSMVAKKKIQHLLVVKLDRLSRETEDAIRLGKMLSKKGVTLHLVAEGGPVDLSDASQEMLFTMRAAMGQFERKRIAMNTKFALGRKRDLGERISLHAPYGFMFIEGKVVENPCEQLVIARINYLHCLGFSDRKLIQQLSSEGLFNRQGNMFTRGAVRNIIKNLSAGFKAAA